MRWPVTLAAGFVSLTALGAHTQGDPPQQAPRTVAVNVTCPRPGGNQQDAVQPWEVRLQVGDSLQWNLIEPILSDTIEISLKETERRWPFANPDRPRGRQIARAHGARDRGRFAYNVTLRCPGPDGQPRLVVIDPEFIID
jgi:hypothetical protein